jgi:hypothetical protein
VRQVAATLDPAVGSTRKRQASFRALQERFRRSTVPLRRTMAKTMASFAPGLFVGEQVPDRPRDNLDLERFFRLPKGHERRIHGHRHAGIRIVLEGPTLVAALDAHQSHAAPFSHADLFPYVAAPRPAAQTEAVQRRRIMRQARSSKRRSLLLRQLEQKYRDSS